MRIDDDRVVEDTAELVRIDSTNPGALESEAAAWVVSRLREAGLPTTRETVTNGRDNVHALVRGRGGGPRLVLLAHLDTVPVADGWTVPPLDAVIRDGRLYGRGACDMKGGVALAVNLLATLAASSETPAGDVLLVATVDEEAPDMLGVHQLVRSGVLRPDDQLLALEPTGLRLRIAQMGLRWLRLTVHGRNAHAGRAHLGIDANHVAARIVDRLKSAIAALPDEDSLLGRARFTCGVLTGGVAPNVVPARAQAMLDVRLVPPQTIDSTVALVHEVAEEVVTEFPGARYDLEPLGAARPPVRASDDAHVVQCLGRAYWEVTGADIPVGGADGHEAYTDASMVAALTGSRSATVFGPGSSDLAHSPDEFVPLADLVLGARVLERMVRGW